MTSETKRNTLFDNLITPDNCQLLLIDYQAVQINTVNSGDRSQLVKRATLATKAFKYFQIPIVLTTLNIGIGLAKDTIPTIKNLLPDWKSFDRTSINPFEDRDVKQAIEKNHRKKLLISGLWTESSVSFASLDALNSDFQVFVLVDTLGGTSKLAHEMALQRMQQAGVTLTTFNQVLCELQRDWGRHNTIPGFVDALYSSGMYLPTAERK